MEKTTDKYILEKMSTSKDFIFFAILILLTLFLLMPLMLNASGNEGKHDKRQLKSDSVATNSGNRREEER